MCYHLECIILKYFQESTSLRKTTSVTYTCTGFKVTNHFKKKTTDIIHTNISLPLTPYYKASSDKYIHVLT